MDDVESGRWLSEALEGGLPQIIAGPAGKAISRLVGAAVDIPAAALKGISTGMSDKAAARSHVTGAIANRVAEMAVNDPEVMDRAMAAMVAETYRGQKNREKVAKVAVEELKQLPQPDEPNSGASRDTFNEGPSDDWMNNFMRYAEDASSVQLQYMFGRILAGEVVQTGSFSRTTLRTVAELDQRIAEDFSLVWAKSIGGAVAYDVGFKSGEWFERWYRLAEVGLMDANAKGLNLPPYRPAADGLAVGIQMRADKNALFVYFHKKCSAQFLHIGFTRIGNEIGSILASPDYRENMRKAGLSYAVDGVARIELHEVGKSVELLYTQTSG